MTDFNPLVSIVIPVYNGSNFLAEAIDSALAQTYQNLEIIVVNDGSTDGGKTEAVAHRYGNKIRYIAQENGGCGAALNTGISHMRGEYFSWLSHDDLYLPNKVEHQVAHLAKIDDKTTIVYGGYQLIKENGKPMTQVLPHNVAGIKKLNTPLFPVLRGLLNGCAMLIAKECFERVGPFDPTLKTTQDYALWFKMARCCRFSYEPEILIKSRVHPNQGTTSIPSRNDEANELWIDMVRSVSPDEAIGVDDSPFRFYRNTADIMKGANLTDAERFCTSLADEILTTVKVSIVIPFFNRIEWTKEALASARAQTHQNIEILLIDDGSTDDVTDLKAAASEDQRVRYVFTPNSGAGAARNRGVAEATAAYVAFLDSDDVFVPEKVQQQLGAMLQKGVRFSHTSYSTMCESGVANTDIAPSGRFSGNVYPKIIDQCPIAMPTVMATKELLARHPFPSTISYGEDICTWIDIAAETEVLGLDAPLSRIRVMPTSASVSQAKAVLGHLNIASYVAAHDDHGKNAENLKGIILAAAVKLDPKLERLILPKPKLKVIVWGYVRGKLAKVTILHRLVVTIRPYVRKLRRLVA